MDASWWWSWFTNFQDDQRIERLQRCQDIHNVLVQCQVQQQQQQQQQRQPQQQRQQQPPRKSQGTTTVTTETTTSTEQSNYNPMSIESFSGGIRTMKYFGWRGILQPPPPPEQPQMLERVQAAIVHSCSREQHALWACRAVAVGCGKELGILKAGFDQVGPWDVLFEPRTAYESTNNDNNDNNDNNNHPHNHNHISNVQQARIPCAELQSSLGTCVRKGADALLERTQTRENIKVQLPAAKVEPE